MPKKKTSKSPKMTERNVPGSKTFALSGPHLLKSWQPPTSYCGVKLTDGLRYATPGYENAPALRIDCEQCAEEFNN